MPKRLMGVVHLSTVTVKRKMLVTLAAIGKRMTGVPHLPTVTVKGSAMAPSRELH
jgi:hypothetical protein